MGNGVQFSTKYEHLQHQEHSRLEVQSIGAATNERGSSSMDAKDTNPMTVIDIGGRIGTDLDGAVEIPLEEATRPRKGSTAVSLKMHDDDDED